MTISKTPFRMSFFGGGTDIPEFFNEHGGAVISTTFDKYCYVNVRHLPRFFDYRNQIVYSKIERVLETDKIQHPAVREAMKYLDMHELMVIYDADLPSRSGLGTSSSFAVGMLNAFYALKGKYVGKKKLADDAIYLERVLCKEAGGLQDQIAAAFGGLNRIDFASDGYKVSPIIISSERKKRLNQCLMLFFTGFSRFSAEIQSSAMSSIKERTRQLLDMKHLADEAEQILVNKNRDLDEFGKLLDMAWKLKRKTGNEVSTGYIDSLYELGISAGGSWRQAFGSWRRRLPAVLCRAGYAS